MKKKIPIFLIIIVVFSFIFIPKLYKEHRIKSLITGPKYVTADCKTEDEQLLALIEYRAQMPFEELIDDMNFMLNNDIPVEGLAFQHGISLALIREEIGAERFREEINNENNHPDLIWLLTEIDNSPESLLRDYQFLSDAVNNPQ